MKKSGNNWIIVYTQIGKNDKLYPFIFDTGAQTVLLDSLVDEVGNDAYSVVSSSKREKDTKHAFNNDLLTVNKLQLGDVTFSNTGVITAQKSRWGMLNCITPYGIIGYNVIQTCTYQINYSTKQITMTDDVEKLPNYHEIQWIKYKPSSNQESPIVKANLSDSIEVNLLFDTGMSGGISILSHNYFNYYNSENENKVISCLSKPSIKIRGENEDDIRSLKTKISNFSLGKNNTKDLVITIKDTPEREFTGFVGNKYLENYIITLDYANKRIGFIPNKLKVDNNNQTYGISYIPNKNKMLVSSVYEGYEPANSGIHPGDEIYSINGKVISDLDHNVFCEIYRKEFRFQQPGDSVLNIQILKNGTIQSYSFQKETMF
jgi:PDZ domain-containing protein